MCIRDSSRETATTRCAGPCLSPRSSCTFFQSFSEVHCFIGWRLWESFIHCFVCFPEMWQQDRRKISSSFNSSACRKSGSICGKNTGFLPVKAADSISGCHAKKERWKWPARSAEERPFTEHERPAGFRFCYTEVVYNGVRKRKLSWKRKASFLNNMQKIIFKTYWNSYGLKKLIEKCGTGR